MACKYIHNGKEYTKEELLSELANGYVDNTGKSTDIFKSIATKKKNNARTGIVNDTITMLQQRVKNTLDVLQAIKTSSDPKDEKIKKTAYYKNILNKTRKSITELKLLSQKDQAKYIIEIALIDAELIRAMYSNKNMSFNELQFANNVVETWSNLNKVFGIEDLSDKRVDPDILDGLKKVLGEFYVLNTQSRAIAKKLIADASKGKLSEKDLDKLVDTTWITRKTRELATAGIPISNHLAYIIKEVNMKINEEHVKNYSLIDKMTAKVKGKYNLFIKRQKDSLGQETLGIVTRYSQDFWEAMRAARNTLKVALEKANGDKTKTNAAWRNFNNWNNENTIVFNSLLFINEASYTDAERNAEIAKIKALGFNQSEINNMILESKKRYSNYQDKLDEYYEMVSQNVAFDPNLIPTGMTEDEYIKMKVDEYDELNNPLKYVQQKVSGAKITASGGSRHTYLIPAKTIKGKDSGYYDAAFSQISADPVLYEFYEWFTGFINQNLNWLPQDQIQDAQSNFLPIITDRVAKEYGFSNLKESVAGLGDWFFQHLAATDFENKTTTNPFTSKEVRDFKSRFIKENVAVENRSTDLNIIAKLFSDMALIYKHKNTIKAEVDTVNDIIQTTEGSYKIDKKLGMIRQQRNAENVQSAAESMVRKLFYGIKPEESDVKSDRTFYSWQELITGGYIKSVKSEKAEKISKRIKEIEKEVNENDQLTEDEQKKLENERTILIGEYYKLGGRKFSLVKTLDSMISGTRLTALGFAPFAAARNLIVGKINNIVHAKGGRDFSMKDKRWATGKLRDAIASYWTGGKVKTEFSKKLFGLISDVGLAEGEDAMYIKTMIDSNSSLDKIRNLLPKAYTLLSGGDYYFKAEMLLAAMKHDKVKLASGEEISLIDALNEEREFDEAKYGPWDETANGGMTFQEYFLSKKLKYAQLANKLHGATGKDVYVEGKDTVIGRILFLFKSWLPETVGVRFDPKHEDGILQRSEEGYYRTFFNMVVKEKLPAVFGMWVKATFNPKDLSIQDEMELANFKKAVAELNVILSLAIAYMLLKAMAPDDDKDKKLYNLLVLRQLKDLMRDLTYYINPLSVNELQRSPFPVMRTLISYGEAMKAVTYYGMGVEGKDGDLMYDEDRTALKVTKVLPVLSNINRVIYYSKQVD
jgi:hypothetical protein